MAAECRFIVGLRSLAFGGFGEFFGFLTELAEKKHALSDPLRMVSVKSLLPPAHTLSGQ